MNLLSVRIITADINQLTNFYEQVTGIKATWYTENFVELQTKSATLAIGSTETLQFFGSEKIAEPAQNRTAIIEFRTENVDADYTRLAGLLKEYLVQEPTTMPWGNRSLLFRDPDGNLVNFFTPVTPQAVKKFDGETAGQ